jgi:hypothetical protein
MLTNADITVYNRHYNKTTRLDEWFRTQICGVNWYGGQAVSVTDSGLQSADTYTVRIPVVSAPQGKQFVLPENYAAAEGDALTGLWTLQAGDIVVRGLVADDITKTADVTGKYSQCFTVTGWRDNRRGSPAVQHWRIDGA